MLHKAGVSYARHRGARRNKADIVDVTVANVICLEVAYKVELGIFLLSLK
jgi:hypothetical protein